MKFTKTNISDLYIIEIEKKEDSRGYFARTFCKKEFASQDLQTDFVQSNIAHSDSKGTLRGMHYQKSPHSETKIVRCTRGSLYDIAIDLRPGSPTFKKWFGTELSDSGNKMLYIPKGFAHGYLTLQDKTEIQYMVSECYTPSSEKGVRYNDPAFNIKWPIEPKIISKKDKNWPDFKN